jgi:hypothetical protein
LLCISAVSCHVVPIPSCPFGHIVVFFISFLIKLSLSEAKILSWEPTSVCHVMMLHKFADLNFYRYTCSRRES